MNNNEEIDRDYLTRYGEIAKTNLKDQYILIYRLFEGMGTLHDYCLMKEKQAIMMEKNLVAHGLNHYEAREMLMEDLLTIRMEEITMFTTEEIMRKTILSPKEKENINFIEE